MAQPKPGLTPRSVALLLVLGVALIVAGYLRSQGGASGALIGGGSGLVGCTLVFALAQALRK
jgi:hypothetical protein